MENLIILKNPKVIKLVKIHLLISFITCLSGLITLWIFYKYFISILLLDISIIIFRNGLLIGIFSIICGIFFEKYLNCQ